MYISDNSLSKIFLNIILKSLMYDVLYNFILTDGINNETKINRG
jgi:hypothetical protein